MRASIFVPKSPKQDNLTLGRTTGYCAGLASACNAHVGRSRAPHRGRASHASAGTYSITLFFPVSPSDEQAGRSGAFRRPLGCNRGPR